MTRTFASGNFTASQPLGELRRNLGVGLLQKQIAPEPSPWGLTLGGLEELGKCPTQVQAGCDLGFPRRLTVWWP